MCKKMTGREGLTRIIKYCLDEDIFKSEVKAIKRDLDTLDALGKYVGDINIDVLDKNNIRLFFEVSITKAGDKENKDYNLIDTWTNRINK